MRPCTRYLFYSKNRNKDLYPIRMNSRLIQALETMTDVSIIIPTYNDGEYIADAINSALEQTLENIEVVVVDDCSTDNTQEVVNSYNDSRIRYIRHKENKGGSSSRNTGIESSSATYIAFLDADDIWEPTKLEKQVRCIESLSEEWVAVYCDYLPLKNERWEKFKRLIASSNRPEGGGEDMIYNLLAKEFSIGTASTILAKREVITSIDGFDEQFDRFQDLEFTIRLLEIGKIGYVDDILVRKRRTEKPSSDTVQTALELYLDKFSEYITELDEENNINVKARHNFSLSKLYFLEGNIKAGINAYFESEVENNLQQILIAYAILIGLSKRVHHFRK